MPVESGKSYFKIKTPFDASQAFIPKGTAVSLEVLQWKFDDMNIYLRSEGIREFMSEAAFAEFRRSLRKYPSGFKEDYVLVSGTPPVEPTPSQMIWLADPDDPHDLVEQNVPFLKVTLPKESKTGRDVYGRPVEPKLKYLPPAVELEMPEEICLLDQEMYVSSRSGQVKLKGHKLFFSSTYILEELGQSVFQKRVWPCGVMLNSDLEARVVWEVKGDLEVKGHWSVPSIVVHGNAIARSGIHTNLQGCLKVFGDFKATYVQMTRMGVGGNLTVDGAILQSELRVVGNVDVKGSPGAIMGSTIDTFGNMSASKVGSDNGRRTTIRIHPSDDRKRRPSRINSLSKGTEMDVDGKAWVQETDGFFTT
jgi:hypothetical protein